MNLLRVKAIVRKDLAELRANKMALLPMIIVPVVLCALLPGVLVFLALRLDVLAVNGGDLIQQILPFYSIPEAFETTVQQAIYVFLNYMFMPFFMLIPVMVSSIMASNSVVGEKERKTLETLLYTPVTNREFVVAKTLSAFIPAVAVSLIGFAGFFAVVTGISLSLEGVWLVQSPLWIPALLLISPAISLLALAVTLMISMRAKSFMEAQQMSAVVVIPVLLLVIAQLTGLFVLSIWHILGFGALLLVADFVLMTRIGPRFEREAILKTL
jgi:ABC-type transport system involved in multi-copper enzyme maturation permease subunit